MISLKEDLKGCNFLLLNSVWCPVCRGLLATQLVPGFILSNVQKKMWRNKMFYVQCPKCPVVTKCCFFIPVRRGIIIFGYINLTVSLLAFPLLVFLLVEQISGSLLSEELQHHRMGPVRLPLTLLWVSIDVLMNVALIFAAHKKNSKVLRLYLYFGIGFQVLTLFVDLVFFEYGDYIENIFYFFFLSLNVYLLYLVYCTVQTLKESPEVQYLAYQEHHDLPAQVPPPASQLL